MGKGRKTRYEFGGRGGEGASSLGLSLRGGGIVLGSEEGRGWSLGTEEGSDLRGREGTRRSQQESQT